MKVLTVVNMTAMTNLGIHETSKVLGLNSNAVHDFLEFHTLLEAKGREIGFDATKYEQMAIRKAQEFWKPTVTGLAGLSRFPD